jgi:hypothetical protein
VEGVAVDDGFTVVDFHRHRHRFPAPDFSPPGAKSPENDLS